MKAQIAILSLSLWSLNASAYVVGPALPPVPAATPATPQAVPNSAKTQALIDQLFDKADYQDFSDETPSTFLDEGNK